MKKIVLVILLVLAIASSVLLATACDGGMIVKNEKRNMAQLTAKISYAGRTTELDKTDLQSTINRAVEYAYASYLSAVEQYPGYDSYFAQEYAETLSGIGDSFDAYNESAAKNEAYILMCIDELYKAIQNGEDEDKKAAAAAASTVNKGYSVESRIAEIVSVLSLEDMIEAVDAYNEGMQNIFDEFREKYEDELKKASKKSVSIENVEKLIVTAPWKLTYEVGDELSETGLSVQVKYNDREEAVDLDRDDYTVTGFDSTKVAKKVTVTVTFGEATETFDVEIVAAKPSRPAKPVEEEEEAEKTEVAERFELALEKQIAEAKDGNPEEGIEPDTALYKVLKEAKRRMETWLEENYRTYDYYYLSYLKTQAISAYEKTITDAVEITDADVEKEYNERLNAQAAALWTGTTTYNSIFGDTAKTIAAGKQQIVHPADGKIYYVQHILLKVTDDLKDVYNKFEAENGANDEALKDYWETQVNKTGIYVSNVEYDKYGECEEEDCTCTACDNYNGEHPGNCEDPDCTCKQCPNKRFVTKEFAQEKGLPYDEATGTINILAVKDKIIAELTALMDGGATPTEMIAAFIDWIYLVGDDVADSKDSDTGERIFKVSQLDNDAIGYSSTGASNWVTDFAEFAEAIAYGSEAEKAKWAVYGEGVGSFGWGYSSYGIHIMMLTGYALDPDQATEDLGGGLCALPLDAIIDYRAYEPAEEEGEPAKGTLAYEIKETLTENVKDAKVQIAKNEFKKNNTDVKISTYKNYEDLIERYKDNLQQ